MRRVKRLNIFRIALTLVAVAAIIPVAAQAKPDMSENQFGSPEIPYLSHGQGVDNSLFVATLGPDDRPLSRSEATERVEIPYLSHGQGVTESDLGLQPLVGTPSPDDRAFTRSPGLESGPVGSDDGGVNVDVNPYVVTGFGIALLLAMGMGLAIWQSRRVRLTTA